MEQIESRLSQVADLLLWPGIPGRRLTDELILLAPDGICFELSGGAPRAGDIVELELHLPIEPCATRIRATAIVERHAPERGPTHVEARFDTIDEPSREALERYLFLLEKKIHATQSDREDSTLERCASWKDATIAGREGSSSSEPAGDEQWHPPAAMRRRDERPRRRPSRVDAPTSRNRVAKESVACHSSLDDRLAHVFELMQALYTIESVDECLELAVDVMSESIPCQAAVGLKTEVTGPRSGAAVAVATRGARVVAARGRSFTLRGSLVEVALVEGVSVSVSNAENDRRLYADVDCLLGAETRSYLCVPIVYEGRSFGALLLLNRQPSGSWQQGELNIATYVASRIGEYIAESLPTGEIEHAAA